MRDFIKNIILVTVPSLIVILIILEFFFRFAFKASQSPNYIHDNTYNITKYQPNTNGQYTVGPACYKMGKWNINNEGWNNYNQYDSLQKSPLIAVIGDSYIEAFQVNADEHVSSLLQKRLPNSRVYSFGISGAPFSHYIHLANYVKNKFAPNLIIINVVHNDFDESLHTHNRTSIHASVNPNDCATIPPKPYQTGITTRLLKKSALINYLVNNVHIYSIFNTAKIATSDSINANINTKAIVKDTAQIGAMLNCCLNDLKKLSNQTKLLIVMDGPRNDIYLNQHHKSSVLFLNQILAKACLQHKVPFIDLSYSFANHYASNGQKFNFDFDGHWNALGHQVVADTLFNYLKTNHYQ
jgi:lysophospholipase L1-like esterase